MVSGLNKDAFLSHIFFLASFPQDLLASLILLAFFFGHEFLVKPIVLLSFSILYKVNIRYIVPNFQWTALYYIIFLYYFLYFYYIFTSLHKKLRLYSKFQSLNSIIH